MAYGDVYYSGGDAYIEGQGGCACHGSCICHSQCHPEIRCQSHSAKYIQEYISGYTCNVFKNKTLTISTMNYYYKQTSGDNCPTHICNCNIHTECPSNVKRNQSTWTDDPINTTTQIKLQHLTELRNAINVEFSVRNILPITFTDPGQYFSSTQFIQIKNAINSCIQNDKNKSRCSTQTYVWGNDTYLRGEWISKNGMIVLRNHVNKLQSVCICNVNKDCTCNCNYCNCNCNYCLCNCNVRCSCYCNY